MNTGFRKLKTTWLSSYSLFLTGVGVILLSALGHQWGWSDLIVSFVRDLGLLLAAVMAGTILHEKLLRDEMLDSIREQLSGLLDSKLPKTAEIGEQSARCTHSIFNADPPGVTIIANQTARVVHRLFSEDPPTMTGIRLLDETRRNFDGYYAWVMETKSQDLFFAGRSVLHRIDADIRARTKGNAEEIIVSKLKEGSRINVLFLDPRIPIIERLAKEEGQELPDMLSDIATSIAICKRLGVLLEKQTELSPKAELSIRIYRRIPYFAFHRQGDNVIVGFYFFSGKGDTSAAYEIVDPKTRQVFAEHFGSIYAEARGSVLLAYNGSRAKTRFNEPLFTLLHENLSSPERLGAAAERILGPRVPAPAVPEGS